MSTVLRDELDLKIQQMKEYGRIMHGYSNDNVPYPIQVRRSHDGEKVRRIKPTGLKSFYDENRMKTKEKSNLTRRPHSYDDQQTINERQSFVPPNKTIDDINPLFLNESLPSIRASSSSSSSNSSPVLHSTRPHSTVTLCSTSSDESTTTNNTKSDEHSQTPLNPSTSLTLTRRILRKIFLYSSKS